MEYRPGVPVSRSPVPAAEAWGAEGDGVPVWNYAPVWRVQSGMSRAVLGSFGLKLVLGGLRHVQVSLIQFCLKGAL